MFSQCQIGTGFNPVINGVEFSIKAELLIDSVKFTFNQLLIYDGFYASDLILVSNNSKDTVFFNPSNFKFYKNDEHIVFNNLKDSIYFIPPNKDEEIGIYEEPSIIELRAYREYKKGFKAIVLELKPEGFRKGIKTIELPRVRYVPENKNDYLGISFPLY